MERITHKRIAELDPAKTFVLATMSPLEVHGPHLPLGQDIFEARALAEHAAVTLLDRRKDWTVLLVPPVPVACDTVPMLGSVEFPPSLVAEVAYHLLEPFAKAGFKRMGYSSFHGGPRHFLAMELAGERLAKRYDVAAVSMFSMLLSRVKEGQVFLDAVKDVHARKVELEHLMLDQHAGYVETSMALYLYPDLIDGEWANLPGAVPETAREDSTDSVTFSGSGDVSWLERAMSVPKTAATVINALRFFRASSYFGYPGFASAHEGKLLFDHLVSLTVEAVDEFIDVGMAAGVHSPLWGLRHVFLNRPMGALVEGVLA